MGYEGLYQVSIDGDVKSLERIDSNGHPVKEKILKPGINNCNYLSVSLSKDGKGKKYLVHRLVAETWLKNPDNLPEVNHIDENPLNNNVENLKWSTQKESNNRETAIQRTVERRPQRRGRPIQIIDPDTGNVIGEYPSAKVAEKYGFWGKSISDCCKGVKKTYRGLVWRYKKEQPVVAVNKTEKAVSKALTNGKTSKAVVALDPKTGIVVAEFPSTREAQRRGFNASTISACCRGKLKTHHGLVWRYAGEPYIPEHNLVVALDKQGRVVHVFPSTMEAGKHGFNEYAVKCCCEGRRKTHRKLVWQYKDDFLKRVC